MTLPLSPQDCHRSVRSQGSSVNTRLTTANGVVCADDRDAVPEMAPIGDVGEGGVAPGVRQDIVTVEIICSIS